MSFSTLDWIVLLATLLGIIVYGVYKGRSSKNLDGYFLGNRQMRWGVVLLSVMGTQASAVTFLTVPGQAFTDGMQFIQFYFGLPLAMVALCVTLVPIFRRLKVYTAYEYLENRFDKKTRTLTSFIFLISRGLSTGISIVAPSLILHSFLGWNIYLTNIIMGGLLIIYTVSGGAKAVAYTQQLQFIIIYIAMFLVGWWAFKSLPGGIGVLDALEIAGDSGKMNIITTGAESGAFDWSSRYNIWSGILGGFFLQLSYFGTDQSQVGRYLTARTTSEAKVSLLLNGLLKIPLQFGILLIGIFIFVFYQFNNRPAYFDVSQEQAVLNSRFAPEYDALRQEYKLAHDERARLLLAKEKAGPDEQGSIQTGISQQDAKMTQARDAMGEVIKKANPEAGVNKRDANYVFLRFVGDHLPRGLVGLVIAIIFLAAWGSIAAALNALASSTIVDFHKQYAKKPLTPKKEYHWSRWYSFFWGIFCVAMTLFATNIGNSLVEAVNILGSWFYGTMLGIFLVAFYLKKVGGTAVFYAAIVSEVVVVIISLQNKISFLWFTVIGALIVIILSYIIQKFLPPTQKATD